MVISTIIAKHHIGRILVENGSLVYLIYWNCFEHMSIAHNQLKRVSLHLYNFTRETISVVGSIRLPIIMGFKPQNVTRQTNFMVVKTTSFAYNAILGRPLLNDVRAIVSSCYLLVKFPTPSGIGQVQGDQRQVHTCYVLSTKGKKSKETSAIAKQTAQD